MNTFTGWGLSIVLAALGLAIPTRAQESVSAPGRPSAPSAIVMSIPPEQVREEKKVGGRGAGRAISFSWGNVSWLPMLASEAGWPEHTHEMLAAIVLRESGGCPNRRGGDMVDAQCNITGVSEWNHRSDTGLLQINGVNYNTERNKWAIACRRMNICTQEPLLDPLTNLRVGYLLYQESGWAPWDPCSWGPKYAHRCKPGGKP